MSTDLKLYKVASLFFLVLLMMLEAFGAVFFFSSTFYSNFFFISSIEFEGFSFSTGALVTIFVDFSLTPKGEVPESSSLS